MRLNTFRELTAHLPGELDLLCAGGRIRIVWHDNQYVSIDDDDDLIECLGDGAVVLHGDGGSDD